MHQTDVCQMVGGFFPNCWLVGDSFWGWLISELIPIWLWPMQYRTSFRLVPNYAAWWQGHMWTTYSVPFDGDMAESRTWNLVYHESNTLITMPYVGV